jgi:hypothetical protein
MPNDWENATGYADPFGVDRSPVKGASPAAQNIDFVIPEFVDVTLPLIITLMIFAVSKGKWKKKKKN